MQLPAFWLLPLAKQLEDTAAGFSEGSKPRLSEPDCPAACLTAMAMAAGKVLQQGPYGSG